MDDDDDAQEVFGVVTVVNITDKKVGRLSFSQKFEFLKAKRVTPVVCADPLRKYVNIKTPGMDGIYIGIFIGVPLAFNSNTLKTIFHDNLVKDG